jgi:hypothetical protein
MKRTSLLITAACSLVLLGGVGCHHTYYAPPPPPPGGRRPLCRWPTATALRQAVPTARVNPMPATRSLRAAPAPITIPRATIQRLARSTSTATPSATPTCGATIAASTTARATLLRVTPSGSQLATPRRDRSATHFALAGHSRIIASCPRPRYALSTSPSPLTTSPPPATSMAPYSVALRAAVQITGSTLTSSATRSSRT